MRETFPNVIGKPPRGDLSIDRIRTSNGKSRKGFRRGERTVWKAPEKEVKGQCGKHQRKR
jgi:hypothetical protein